MKKQYCKPRSTAAHIIVDNLARKALATVDMNPKKRWAWEQETETETGMRIKVRRGCLTLFLSVEEFDRIFQTKKRDERQKMARTFQFRVILKS